MRREKEEKEMGTKEGKIKKKKAILELMKGNGKEKKESEMKKEKRKRK